MRCLNAKRLRGYPPQNPNNERHLMFQNYLTLKSLGVALVIAAGYFVYLISGSGMEDFAAGMLKIQKESGEPLSSPAELKMLAYSAFSGAATLVFFVSFLMTRIVMAILKPLTKDILPAANEPKTEADADAHEAAVSGERRFINRLVFLLSGINSFVFRAKNGEMSYYPWPLLGSAYKVENLEQIKAVKWSFFKGWAVCIAFIVLSTWLTEQYEIALFLTTPLIMFMNVYLPGRLAVRGLPKDGGTRAVSETLTKMAGSTEYWVIALKIFMSTFTLSLVLFFTQREPHSAAMLYSDALGTVVAVVFLFIFSYLLYLKLVSKGR